jgi:hypothetical protein
LFCEQLFDVFKVVICFGAFEFQSILSALCFSSIGFFACFVLCFLILLFLLVFELSHS